VPVLELYKSSKRPRSHHMHSFDMLRFNIALSRQKASKI